MLATQIRQKDSIFYFGSYPATDLLNKVRFISRFYGDSEEIAPARISQSDEIAQFIAKIERTDSAFQRGISKAKVRSLKNFYETAVSQPPIPGTVLLFTSEKLRFQTLSGAEGVGHLGEPQPRTHRQLAAVRRDRPAGAGRAADRPRRRPPRRRHRARAAPQHRSHRHGSVAQANYIALRGPSAGLTKYSHGSAGRV